MKLAMVGAFDIRNVRKRSGTPLHMAKGLERAGIDLQYISPLKTYLPFGFKTKRFLQQTFCGQQLLSRSNLYTVKKFSEQVQKKLVNLDVQAVLTHILDPLAYVECKQPLITWTDGAYANFLGFYPEFSKHSAQAVKEVTEITRAFFANCRLAIFSSDWAARGALEYYGVSKEKVKVVPFGANIDCQHTLNDIRDMLQQRSQTTLNLLFLGKDWYRKGGDTVLAVTKALHESGQKVRLTIVGCNPPNSHEPLPSYVTCLGYISKQTPEGVAKIDKLLRESHFLFLPSRAEACAIAFCEASAYGLPILTSYVGGISTVVKNNVNGMTFPLDASTKLYCDYLSNLMQNRSQYEALSFSAFNEYQTRLNWDVSSQAVKRLIKEVL